MSDKRERLLQLILTLLETTRPLTAEEVRERVPGYPESLPAFRRAFERDKEALRELGIEISLEPVPFVDPPATGYRIHPDDYYLRDPGFAPDELAALHLAVSAIRVDTPARMEGLYKFGGVVADEAPGRELAALPVDERLVAVWQAIVDHAPLELSYRERRRRLDPLRLDFQRGRWYLTAHDRDHGEERVFRMDRVEGEVAVGEPGSFEPPAGHVPGGPAQPWEYGGDPPVEARLVVDAAQAVWARQFLGEGAVAQERADGSVVFRLEVTNRAAFRSFVLSFLEHAELLGPPELRDDLVAWLQGLAG